MAKSNLFNSSLKGYSRLERTTLKTFKDFRLYNHNYSEDTEIRTRSKSSRRFIKYNDIYFFTTKVCEKNTVNDNKLRYHYNQGFGYFLQNKNNYNLTLELGSEFDSSDYLNSQIRTSFLKNSLSCDLFIKNIKSKFKVDHFYRMSKMRNHKSLSRLQILGEIQLSINDLFNYSKPVNWNI
jgi:hypothetical protein